MNSDLPPMTCRATESSRPLFSIVTVTLNSGAALQRTADSIAAQTFRDFEHVIKDAGSSDGSIDRLRAPYPNRVVTEPDAGIYDAMNQAIGACRGRFIQFLNAGDVLAGPEVLAQVARAAHDHAECQLFYCDNVNATTGLRSRVPERASRFYLFRRPICHQAWFVAFAAFEAIGPFDRRYPMAADHDFFVRAVVSNRMAARRVPILGVVYEGAGASARPEGLATVLRDFADIRLRHFSFRERLVYGLAVGLTAQRARLWIASGPLGPLYVSIVNGIRRARP